MRAPRSFAVVAVVLNLGLLVARTGQSEEASKKPCAVAFESAQRLMRSGHLAEARKKLVLCGGPQCPAVMQPDCQRWLSEVEASTPTVVLNVAAAAGAPPRDVRIAIDGGEWASFDGRAINLDPGQHDISARAPGFATTTKQIVVSEGEKLRREALILQSAPTDSADRESAASAPSAAPSEPSNAGSPISLPVILASSVGAVAGVGVVYFGLKARSDDRELDRCSPDCTWASVDQVKREYLWTNVSIGVAAAALATAGLLLVIDLTSAKSSAPTSARLGIGLASAGIGPSAVGTF